MACKVYTSALTVTTLTYNTDAVRHALPARYSVAHGLNPVGHGVMHTPCGAGLQPNGAQSRCVTACGVHEHSWALIAMITDSWQGKDGDWLCGGLMMMMSVLRMIRGRSG